MKNKIIYKIGTPYGHLYETDKNGYVIKYSNGLNKINGSMNEIKTWQITGLREVLPFNNLGRLIPLKEAAELTDIKRKNGNPRYTLEDIDHGTTRIHGNYTIHGVRFIELNK